MLRHVIAKRRYDLMSASGERLRDVTIRFGRPVGQIGTYRCFYQVEGVSWGGTRYAMGADAVQALLLAMTHAANRLYNSNEFKGGLILLNGSRNLDLPLIALGETDAVPDPTLHLTV